MFNRVHAIKDGSPGSGTNLVEYKYLGGGRAVVADYTEPNVKLDLWGSTVGTYDGLDRFGRVIDQRWIDYAGSPVDLARLQYGYDRDSLPNFRRDVVAHAAGEGFDELYTRDGLNRLNNYQRGLLNTANTAIDTLSFEQDWSLSQVANWDAFDQDNTGNGTNDLAQTRTHNQVNEITGITNTTGTPWINPAYDSAGNTTTLPKPETPTEGFTAKYDAWNRMVALHRESDDTKAADYTYDGRNFRIQKKLHDSSGVLQDTFDFYYTSGWQCIEEVKTPAPGSPRTGSLSQYVWGLRYIDDLVLRDLLTGSSTTPLRHYALSDRNFSVVAIVDDGGSMEERYTYTPYGQVTFMNESWEPDGTSFDWTHLFQGLRRDQESGLIENRERVLHPTLGRFLQRDPLGYPDGMNAYVAYHVVSSSWDPMGLLEEVEACKLLVTLRYQRALMDIQVEFALNEAAIHQRMRNISEQADLKKSAFSDTLDGHIRSLRALRAAALADIDDFRITYLIDQAEIWGLGGGAGLLTLTLDEAISPKRARIAGGIIIGITAFYSVGRSIKANHELNKIEQDYLRDAQLIMDAAVLDTRAFIREMQPILRSWADEKMNLELLIHHRLEAEDAWKSWRDRALDACENNVNLQGRLPEHNVTSDQC
ncbi:MAG: RHS repeat-associated core domain-containing protein [Planctomycetota bacterium]